MLVADLASAGPRQRNTWLGILFDAITAELGVPVPTPMHTTSIDEWWSVVPSLAGPVAQLLASLPAEVSFRRPARAEEALAGFVTADGCELPRVCHLGVGRR